MKPKPRTEFVLSLHERLRFHERRVMALSDHDATLVLFHFLGALGSMCEPTSIINRGPTREAIVEALERAVNARTGT